MKKGISLIVLVITIIVMIIIAGAIIISLNSSNVMEKANKAVKDSDLANAKNAVTLAYAEATSRGEDGKAYNASSTVMTASDYYTALENAGFADASTKFVVTVDANGVPTKVENKAE